MTAVGACHCSPCARGDGDPDMRALHADRHAIFQTLMNDRPDWHFRRPSPRRIVELAAQEWSVPVGACQDHIGTTPPHPVHP